MSTMNITRRDGESPMAPAGATDDTARLFRREIENALGRAMRPFDVNPFRLFDNLQSLSAWPAIDIKEEQDAMTIHVDVPGMRPEDIDIELSGQELTIRGKREEVQESKEKGAFHRERFAGSFRRTIDLPAGVAADRATAHCERGVLAISLPMRGDPARKRIPVASSK